MVREGAPAAGKGDQPVVVPTRRADLGGAVVHGTPPTPPRPKFLWLIFMIAIGVS